MLYVPVVDKNQNPLMPTAANRAATWIKSGKATPFWKRGVFCVRLNVDPSGRALQPVAVGIDPGSKKEGFTVKSESHTYLNIQVDAVTWVKDAVEIRRMMRKSRRSRKTPYRQPRFNCARGGLPPSTKARWQWKLRISNWLTRMYPVTCFVVEDIKAVTKVERRWDVSFSPLEVGKEWFYEELRKIAHVETKLGYETKELRDAHGLAKCGNKMLDSFNAHCVDSWVLANWYVGGHIKPDSEQLLLVKPLRFHRRKLHMLQPAKGGLRRRDGGTRSLGFKRGSLVKHPKVGLVYVGGYTRGRISLHSLQTGERIFRTAKPGDCKFLTFNSWRAVLPLPAKAGSLRAAYLMDRIFHRQRQTRRRETRGRSLRAVQPVHLRP
jgi:hypothetical protein